MNSETPIKKVFSRVKKMNGLTINREYPLGSLTSTTKEKADMLINHFCRHKTVGDIHIEEFVESFLAGDMILESAISTGEVIENLQTIKDTSPGEDRIMNIMLKKVPEEIVQRIVDLFNTSWIISSLPKQWKTGIICPIPKPGKDLSKVEGYHPITLLPSLGKLLEKIIKNRIDYHMESENLFHNSQIGFRKEKSTNDALLRIKQNISWAIKEKQYCIIVYLDVESAFDWVWHQGILYKMIQLGFSIQMVRWIRDFLKDRTSKVRIGNVYSKVKEVEVGVPQGSGLSPSLFNIMLSDLPRDPWVKVVTYADDITLITRNNSIVEAKRLMQGYLNEIAKWISKWKFTINPSVSTYQVFTNKRVIPEFSLKFCRKELTQVKTQKVLGIVLDAPRLTFESY